MYYMPDKKKEKKVKKVKKDKRKKITKPKKMTVIDTKPIPSFGTALNREIPGGIAPMSAMPSYAYAGYNSKTSPSQPAQTPDAFSIIQAQKQQTELIADVIAEQKVARKERSDKGVKRGPNTPLKQLSLLEQLRQEIMEKTIKIEPVETPMAPKKIVFDTPIKIETPMKIKTDPLLKPVKIKIEKPAANTNIIYPPNPIPPPPVEPPMSKRKPKVEFIIDEEEPTPSSFSQPPVNVDTPEFEGGGKVKQQGLFMGTPSNIRNPNQPDASGLLDGTIDPSGGPDVFF